MGYEEFDTSLLQSFDGESFDEGFMPNSGTFKKQNLKRRNKWDKKKGGLGEDATFTITVTNQTSNTERFELFNALNSIAYAPNDAQYSQVPVAGSAYQPLSTGKIMQFFATICQNSANNVFINPQGLIANTALFDDGTGSLVYVRNPNFGVNIGTTTDVTASIEGTSPVITATQKVVSTLAPSLINTATAITISCQEVPYERLLKSLTSMIFSIERVRVQTNNTANFGNSYEIVEFNDFGLGISNSKNPLSDFSPNQFQNNIVDLMVDILVDKNVAWYQNIVANSYMTYTFFVKAYRDAGAIWDL
jgi:hypothetical protein